MVQYEVTRYKKFVDRVTGSVATPVIVFLLQVDTCLLSQHCAFVLKYMTGSNFAWTEDSGSLRSWMLEV